MADFSDIIQKIIIWAPGILFAITMHEWAHGFMASRFGDHTAAMMGRLTLNPIPHIDPVWTIMVPAVLLVVTSSMGHPFVIGGAKPVPINPRNFRGNLRNALFWVSFAGPLMNLLLALFCAMMMHGVALLPDYFARPLAMMLIAAISMNVLLAVFNMMPIPPLDGGRVAVALLPAPLDRALARLEPMGMVIIVMLIFTGLLGAILWPLMSMLSDFYFSVAGLKI